MEDSVKWYLLSSTYTTVVFYTPKTKTQNITIIIVYIYYCIKHFLLLLYIALLSIVLIYCIFHEGNLKIEKYLYLPIITRIIFKKKFKKEVGIDYIYKSKEASQTS